MSTKCCVFRYVGRERKENVHETNNLFLHLERPARQVDGLLVLARPPDGEAEDRSRLREVVG